MSSPVYTKYLNENVAQQRVNLERIANASQEYLHHIEEQLGFKNVAGTSYRSRLMRIYSVYNPSRVEEVDYLLRRWTNNEEVLFNVMHSHYGKEPPPPDEGKAVEAPPEMLELEPSTVQERIYAMYHKYNPSKLSELPGLLQKYTGRENALLQALVRKYGLEPHEIGKPRAKGRIPTYRERLEIMYRHYDPSRMREMDALLARFPGQERKLLKTMVLKHGAEPGGPYPEEPEEPRKPLDFKQRLKGYFLHYDKTQLHSLDSALKRFAGNEEELFRYLTSKYGPEPSQDELEALLYPSEFQLDKMVAQAQSFANTKVAKPDHTKEILADFNQVPYAKMSREDFEALVARFLDEFDPDLAEFGAAIAMPFFEKAETEDFVNAITQYYRYFDKCVHTSPFTEQLNLLHMVYYCDEVTQMGGVQAYTKKIPQDKRHIVLRDLTRAYGAVPSLEHVATRTRYKRYFAAYNPNQVHNFDGLLQHMKLEELKMALDQKFEHEPDFPEFVDFDRVQPYLALRARGLVNDIEMVIDAHCQVEAQNMEDVMHYIEESYGPEPSPKEYEMLKAKARCMMNRLRTMVDESQLRELIRQKYKADTINRAEELRAAEQAEREAAEAHVALSNHGSGEGKGLLGKLRKAATKIGNIAALTQDTATKEKHDEARAERQRKMLKDLQDIEESQRMELYQLEHESRQTIMRGRNSIIDASHGLRTLPLLELVKRQPWEDDAAYEWNLIMEQHSKEWLELQKLISSRLIWRQRWEEWELIKAAKSVQAQRNAMDWKDQQTHNAQETAEVIAKQQKEREEKLRREIEVMERLLEDQRTRVVNYEAGFSEARRTYRYTLKHTDPILLPIESPAKPTPERRMFKPDSALSRLQPRVKYLDVARVVPVRIKTRSDVDVKRLVLTQEYQPMFQKQLDPYTVQLAKHSEQEQEFRDSCRKYVTEVFTEYAPHRMMEVDKLMERFSGREDELMDALSRQYGVDDDGSGYSDTASDVSAQQPMDGPMLRARVVQFLKKYDPNAIETVDALIAEYKDRVPELLHFLERTYGPENLKQKTVTPAEGKTLLLQFYDLRCPQLTPQVDYIIQEYDGNFNLIDVMLRKKYGSGIL